MKKVRLAFEQVHVDCDWRKKQFELIRRTRKVLQSFRDYPSRCLFFKIFFMQNESTFNHLLFSSNFSVFFTEYNSNCIYLNIFLCTQMGKHLAMLCIISIPTMGLANFKKYSINFFMFIAFHYVVCLTIKCLIFIILFINFFKVTI